MVFYMDILNYVFTGKTTGGLKIILMIHFTLTALGGVSGFGAVSYVFYNSIIILSLLWTILLYDEKNLQALRLLMGFELCAFLIDIFYLGSLIISTNLLSAVIIFLHCASRPCVAVYLIKRKNLHDSSSFTDNDGSDIYGSMEKGLRQNSPVNKNFSDTQSKEMTSLKDRRFSIENNPFENDFSEISTKSMK